MKLNESENQILNCCESPILVESVRAKITLNRQGQSKIYFLSHDGLCKPDASGAEQHLETDGNRDKTYYYLITY